MSPQGVTGSFEPRCNRVRFSAWHSFPSVLILRILIPSGSSNRGGRFSLGWDTSDCLGEAVRASFFTRKDFIPVSVFLIQPIQAPDGSLVYYFDFHLIGLW